MIKRIPVILCVAILASNLSGCMFLMPLLKDNRGSEQTTVTEATTEAAAEADTAPVEIPETTKAADPSTPVTEAPSIPTEPASTESIPDSPVPYLVNLPYELSIFDAPGYNSNFVQPIGEDGVFTIVEETTVEQMRWGKLKSGLGWVNLSHAQQTAPMTAAFAGDKILEMESHRISLESSEHSVKLVFRAYAPLTDVRLVSLTSNDNAYTTSKTLYILPQMQPEKPLIVELVFHGDMTAYGISFVEETGTHRHFCATISGRNGSVDFSEYTP